jgi:4-hydroxybenzoate polyprenyltransferase/phosphoserine phosphatase
MTDRSASTLPEILAVDLDGTLLRSNMLNETFWSAFARNWRMPLLAGARLLKGRAALKEMLAQRSTIDVAVLPYDEDVLSFIREWRERGGRAVLVTATNQTLAEAIAAHLGLFDEAIGSDALRNLKGAHKAKVLVERFGNGNFAYIGDAPADIPVWRDSGHAVVAGGSRALHAKAQTAQPSVAFLPRQNGELRALVQALRPHQWLKNLLVFLAALCGHHLDADTTLHAVAAFAAFSLVASSVYLINDLLDLSADRLHPRKRDRPFASGRAKLEHGAAAAMLLLIGGGALSVALGAEFLVVMLIYYAATTAYSLVLKRRTIIDICMLAALYTIRVFAGGAATHITISVWLLAFSLFFFFSLAAVKRQAELVDAAAAGKLTLHGRGYHADDVSLVAQMATASGYVSVLIMTLYINSDAITPLYNHPAALWGICPVLLFWISRMIFLAHRGQMHDDPVVFAARDQVSLVCGALILGFGLAGFLP